MRVLRLLGVLCAVCALAAIVGNAAPRALASVSLADISSAGPLTNIQIGIDLSCQVEHTGDTDLEFYPPSVSPGDCGTMLSVNGSVYRPDFESHDRTATGNLTAALGSEVPSLP